MNNLPIRSRCLSIFFKLFAATGLAVACATPCFADDTVAGEPVATGAAVANPDIADAAEVKAWSRLTTILTGGADINATQPDGMSALHWAVHHGHRPTVEQLTAAGSDVDLATRYNVTSLSIACTLNDAGIVKILLEAGADASAKQSGGITCLMLAARTGNAESVQHLLNHKAAPNATERSGQTALMWAAAEGNEAAVDVLIKANADLNIEDKSGFTAMMFAARQGRRGVVEALLTSGVDVNFAMTSKRPGNRAPRNSTSALLMAVESGHFELAMFLVQHAADPNDQRSGFTPLHVVTWVRRPKRGEDPDGDPPPRGSGNLTSSQFVKDIVAAGADVNAQLQSGKGGKAFLNSKGATAMLFASKTADLPLMSLLVKLGANPHITNVDNSTALMAAAGVGVRAVGEEPGTEAEVMEALGFLISHGLNVNAVDDNKETAMHGAAYRNFPAVVNYLAQHGADSSFWNHKNAYGSTPVMIAEGKRPGSFKPSPETVRALQSVMSQ